MSLIDDDTLDTAEHLLNSNRRIFSTDKVLFPNLIGDQEEYFKSLKNKLQDRFDEDKLKHFSAPDGSGEHTHVICKDNQFNVAKRELSERGV